MQFAHRLAAASIGLMALSAGAAPPATGPATAPTTRPVAATQPAPVMTPAIQAQIDAAVKDLSADDWKQRQAGQDKLARLGVVAGPTLSKLAARAEDEEVRTRASAALRQIEESAQVGGSIVTLRLKDAKPQEAFEQLARQARTTFPTQPRNLFDTTSGNVTIDLDGVDFWTAFKEVCQKTGVYPQPYGNETRMTLHRGSNPYWNGPSTVSGPFLIVANRIQRTNSVELTTPDNITRECMFGLTAFAEPKLRVIQGSYMVRTIVAEDENGNSLATDDRSTGGYSAGRQWMWNLQARIKYPENNPGKRIARFKGSINFIIQLESEMFDIPDVLTAKSVEKRIAGRRILFKQAKKQGDQQYEVQVTLFRDGIGQAEWNASMNSASGFKLLDKDGKALQSHGWGSSSDGSKVDYTWNFSRQNFGGEDGRPGEPHRLTWEIPTETRDVEVPFEFKNLPLP